MTDGSQVKRYGTLIDREGRRLSDMVSQVLEFAGMQAGRRAYEPRPTALPELVAGVLEDCRPALQETNLQMETDFDGELPEVMADAQALRRALQNLIGNAIKYGAGGGWIGIRVEKAGARGREVRLRIEDRGPGIAAADLPHVFEPFYRGRDVAAGTVPGSGLGLSLVRHIVEAHGGRIAVENQERGCAFTVRLPIAPAAPADSPAGAPLPHET